MKKIIVLTAFVAFMAGLVFICSDTAIAASKDKKPATEPKVMAPAPVPVKAPEGKVICKFKDKDQMTEFEQLYVAKQATFGRMSVLQAYFSLEQNNLQEIDKQMESKFKFKMDPSKMYDLNRENMEIREVGDVPKPEAPAAE